MHAATDQLPNTELTPRRILPGRSPRPTPRIVTTASLTSHVHTLAGPPGSSGPVFVLLHGIGMSHRYYRRLQALLARHGDTHAIDLPGFGGTPTPDRQLSVADYAHHTAATLEKMGASRVVLIGHSMGTQFATELAVQRPDLVSHVVLLGPVVDPERRTVRQQTLTLGLDGLKESPMGNAIMFADYVRSGLRWYLTELPVMMTYALETRLALVHQPVLIIRGSRDPVAPRNWCEKLAATAPNGRFLEIPGKPHIVQHGGAAGTAASILGLASN
ncbi:alpha/beta fold hydrolase [Arthrobacter sp. ZGTC412]|uniref:alpha/beta fold hydrolase n=1 Tax=Arthrobacter sp. ZGTC412 TaxID=2058900 RepID=UPI000CE4AA9E|nr:alpha/beta hydrolase [Arthrobacter sp. ZGTC412]